MRICTKKKNFKLLLLLLLFRRTEWRSSLWRWRLIPPKKTLLPLNRCILGHGSPFLSFLCREFWILLILFLWVHWRRSLFVYSRKPTMTWWTGGTRSKVEMRSCSGRLFQYKVMSNITLSVPAGWAEWNEASHLQEGDEQMWAPLVSLLTFIATFTERVASLSQDYVLKGDPRLLQAVWVTKLNFDRTS